jgi:transposase
MAPLRGWGERGERLIGKSPHGRWRTYTFLAALRSDRVDAPFLFDGPINSERFRAWIEPALVPPLKPGDVVVLDNLSSHKGKVVRQAIRDAGAHLLFLPAYSPDLNPIEQFFAKLKHWLRRQNLRSPVQRNSQYPRRSLSGRVRKLHSKLWIRSHQIVD